MAMRLKISLTSEFIIPMAILEINFKFICLQKALIISFFFFRGVPVN